MSEENKETYEG